MDCLVTGGNGFIGTALIKVLISSGHNVTSIDDLSIGVKENEVDGVRYIYDDANNLFKYEINVDVVFHLAGLSRIQNSYDEPTETFFANTITTQVVCDWARQTNVNRVIYSGSSSRWHDPHISPYACYKYLGEEICKMFRVSYDMNIHIVRFYNVYGPGEIMEGEWAAVIGKWRQMVKEGKSIIIVGDGEQRRDFTHIDDIVSGLIEVMGTKHTLDDAWELGTGENHSMNEVYEMFKEKYGSDSIHVPNQKGNYRETMREKDDALDLLEWKPTDKLKDYIASL